MPEATDGSRQRAMKFLHDERREIASPPTSNFLQSSEAYVGSKGKMKGARDISSVHPVVGRMRGSQTLPETNIGFKLLKKSGWKEGSGLGVLEQGSLNPVDAQHKLDRRGIGAERKFSKKSDGTIQREPSAEDERETKKSKQVKNLSKVLKQQADAERMQEAAFARDFYRELPENV